MTDVSQLEEWFGEEDLDEELEQYLEENEDGWTMIRHPLVYSIMHMPPLNKRINLQLRQKQEAVAKALEEREWHSYIFLHERPYRCQAFQEIAAEMDDAEYWETLSLIWRDSENIRQNPEDWEALLNADRERRSAMMDDDEFDALTAMPDVIPVYQGCTVERDDGWSWTTDIKTATWFAHRFASLEGSYPVLLTGTVPKAAVVAYLTGRNESEIIVRPSDVTITLTESLPHKTDSQEEAVTQ
jgi:hypothetical protein